MLQCQHCRHVNDEAARFCVACGRPLAAQGGATSANPTAGAQPTGATKPGVTTDVQAAVRVSTQNHQPVASTSGPVTTSRLPFAETAPPILDGNVADRPILNRNASRSQANTPAATPGLPAHQRSRGGTAPMSIAQPLEVPLDAPRTLVGFLVSYDGTPLGQSWPIHQGKNVIGRLGAMGGADIELPHATVSHQHATLWASASSRRVQIVAQRTTNGTTVGETALEPERRRELADGDTITLGLFKLVVKII